MSDNIFDDIPAGIKRLMLSQGFFPAQAGSKTRNRTRANGEGSIRPKGKGYEGRVTVGRDADGKPIRKSVTGKTKKECHEKMEALRKKYEKLADRRDDPQKSTTPTLLDSARKWVRTYKPNLAYRTEMEYKQVLDIIDRSEVGHKLITEINSSELQELINAIPYYGAAKKTAKTLNETYLMEMSDGRAQRNPAHNVIVALKPSPPKYRPDEKALTDDEQQRFVAAIEGHPYRLLYLISLYAGLRAGELSALTWDEIDLDNRIITVKQSAKRVKSSTYIISTTKTASSVRKVYMCKALYDILSGTPKTGKYVCEEDGAFVPPNILTEAFGSLMDELGMSHTLHHLRHTFSTRCNECGVDLKVIQAWMGHAKVDMTANTYTHQTKRLFDDGKKLLDDI